MEEPSEILTGFQDMVSQVRSCHAKAVSSYSEAICCDENADNAGAISSYVQALRYSEDGLRQNVFDHEEAGETWNDIREMQERMIIIQGNAKQRIYELQSNTTIANAPNGTRQELDLPPPYAVQDTMTTYPTAPILQECAVNTLLYIEYGVQLYFVSSDNQVGSPPPCYPTSLTVLQLNPQAEGDPEVIIEVGEKVYPLVKNQMPVYKSPNGVYMFPNCNEAGIVEGSFGIVIPHNAPIGVREQFEGILQRYGVYRCDDPDDGFVDLSEFVGKCTAEDDYIPPRMSERITKSLTSGANFLSDKLQRGTRYTTKAIEHRSDEMLSQSTPSKSGMSIHPAIKQGLEYTNSAAKATVLVKNWLIDWLRQITVAVSQQIGPYVTKAIDSTSETTKSGIDGACSVAHASFTSFAQIWSELENSASKITKAVTSAMVKNVEYKYGHEAGDAAGLAIGAVASIGETAFTLDNIGTKVIAGIATSYSCLDGRPLGPDGFEDNSKEKENCECAENDDSTSVPTICKPSIPPKYSD